ncbi:DUF4382 domain-containing protein [Salinimicrobium oceani]|uniref:DUF4382 domain-containing protein n=1 Tax=Salinimicrobium oceani TaxID=2722702 RepID=A0ABX1D074_9FLAO|nr:DUF4382 domain-containing protein [Salinimicrobium oceani]NJW51956.1 DUF4382 domain-containing protein [Salinimicrobium oceani]
MSFLKNLRPTLYFVMFSALLSCSTDDDNVDTEGSETYSTDIYLTDSPIDNAEVTGVFVTIADVKVNGTSIDGFSKTTIDVSTLTEGSTQLLGNIDLEAGTTSNVVLVLDNETDASGNAPGSYVLTSSGDKKALLTGESQININDNAEIFSSGENELVIDFDLRKSIQQNAESNYSFVSNSRLSNSLRVVNTIEAGTITGTVSNSTSTGADAVVVYAYRANSYSESEMQTDNNGVAFTNAVSSTAVSNSNGEFSLHFLEEGNYELVFASYEDTDNDGRLELQGELQMNLTGDLSLNDIQVSSNSTVNLNLAVEGLLDL